MLRLARMSLSLTQLTIVESNAGCVCIMASTLRVCTASRTSHVCMHMAHRLHATKRRTHIKRYSLAHACWIVGANKMRRVATAEPCVWCVSCLHGAHHLTYAAIQPIHRLLVMVCLHCICVFKWVNAFFKETLHELSIYSIFISLWYSRMHIFIARFAFNVGSLLSGQATAAASEYWKKNVLKWS